jgi:hypothetical protein
MVIYRYHTNRFSEFQGNASLFTTKLQHKVAVESKVTCSNYCLLYWMHTLQLLSTDSQIATQSSFFVCNLLNSTHMYSCIFKAWPRFLHYLYFALCYTPYGKIAGVRSGDLGDHTANQRRRMRIGNFSLGKAPTLLLIWGWTSPSVTSHLPGHGAAQSPVLLFFAVVPSDCSQLQCLPWKKTQSHILLKFLPNVSLMEH